MIQRKQNLYLLLGSAIGVASIFFPLFTLSYNGEEYQLLKGFLINSEAEIQFFAWYFLPVLITACLYGFLSIFRYKNLVRQAIAVKTNLWISGLSIVGMIAFLIQATNQLGGYVDFDFAPSVFGPIVLLAFNYLAYKSIKSDINLIKSVDRIR